MEASKYFSISRKRRSFHFRLARAAGIILLGSCAVIVSFPDPRESSVSGGLRYRPRHSTTTSTGIIGGFKPMKITETKSKPSSYDKIRKVSQTQVSAMPQTWFPDITNVVSESNQQASNHTAFLKKAQSRIISLMPSTASASQNIPLITAAMESRSESPTRSLLLSGAPGPKASPYKNSVHAFRSRSTSSSSRDVSVKAASSETVDGGTMRKKSGESEHQGRMKTGAAPLASITKSVENIADNVVDFFAGLSPKTCSSTRDCLREHAFDERVGYECCSFGVVNMCCFPPDDDDQGGGFGRPLVPELEAQLIPIPVRNDPVPEPFRGPQGGYGGGGGYGGYPPY